jgi:hypothetical protein
VATGRLIKSFAGPKAGVRTVAILPRGIRVASGGWYGNRLARRDPKTGEPIFQPLQIWDGPFD